MTFFCKIIFRHTRPFLVNGKIQGDGLYVANNYHFCFLSKSELMDRKYIQELIKPIVIKEGYNSVNTEFYIIDVEILDKT